MSLRSQVKDEIDKEVEEKKRASLMIDGLIVGPIVVVCYSVVFGLFDWFTGKILKLYGQEIGGMLAVLLVAAFAGWILFPLYDEFRFRTKEIDGKVSAIEEAVNESKEGHAELLERLTAIEEKLTEIQDARRV